MAYMTSRKYSVIIGLLATLLVGALPMGVSAEPITFTYTGTGTGTIGTTPIVDIDFTITAVSDTDARHMIYGGIYYEDHSWASITIEGIGSYEFTTGTRTFVNQGVGNGQIGFSRAGASGYDLYSNLNSPVFEDWEMLTSTGLIVGNARLKQWYSPYEPVETTGGSLKFDEQWTNCTFQATIGSIPEPSTFVLIAIGLISVLAMASGKRVK